MYNNTDGTKCQDQLTYDKLSDRKAAARITSVRLAMLGHQTNDGDMLHTATAMHNCGNSLLMREYVDGTKQVASAIFCKSRLCPMCQWRRARKEAGQLSEVMRVLDDTIHPAWLALTYSPRAMPDIASGIDSMDNVLQSYQRLWRKLPPCCLGAFRAVEMRQSDGAVRAYAKGWWQPHIHSIICVNRSYFTSRDYLSRDAWTKLICAALHTDTVQLHVERIDGTDRRSGSTVETAKYCVKPASSIIDIPDAELSALYHGIRRRRMHAYLGIMRTTYHQLYATDDALADNADLTNGVDDLPIDPRLEYWYRWLTYTDGAYRIASPMEIRALDMAAGLAVAAADPLHDQEIYPIGAPQYNDD